MYIDNTHSQICYISNFASQRPNTLTYTDRLTDKRTQNKNKY